MEKDKTLHIKPIFSDWKYHNIIKNVNDSIKIIVENNKIETLTLKDGYWGVKDFISYFDALSGSREDLRIELKYNEKTRLFTIKNTCGVGELYKLLGFSKEYISIDVKNGVKSSIPFDRMKDIEFDYVKIYCPSLGRTTVETSVIKTDLILSLPTPTNGNAKQIFGTENYSRVCIKKGVYNKFEFIALCSNHDEVIKNNILLNIYIN